MRNSSLVLIALASAALSGVSMAQDGSESYMCTGILNNVTYRVFAVGGAGLTARVEVPGRGDYVLRKGTGGWLTGADGISFFQFSSPYKLKDSLNKNGLEFDCVK